MRTKTENIEQISRLLSSKKRCYFLCVFFYFNLLDYYKLVNSYFIIFLICFLCFGFVDLLCGSWGRIEMSGCDESGKIGWIDVSMSQ